MIEAYIDFSGLSLSEGIIRSELMLKLTKAKRGERRVALFAMAFASLEDYRCLE